MAVNQDKPISQSPLGKSTGRVAFADVAKGIGIILVVWYHTDFSPMYLLNAFFMPLFFMLSGMFFSVEMEPRAFFRKKSRRLLLPILLGAALGLLAQWLLYDFWEVHNTLNQHFYSFWLVGNVPLWFLLTLFYMMTIVYVTEHYVSRPRLRWTIYGLITVAGYVLSRLQVINTAFIGHSFLALPFFLVGYKWRDMWLQRRWLSWPVVLLCVGVALLLLLVVQPQTNFHRLRISKDYISSFALAIALVIIVLTISVWLAKTALGRALMWVGESSMTVLILHDLMMHPFTSAAARFYGEAGPPLVVQLAFLPVAVVIAVVCVLAGKGANLLISSRFRNFTS